jgi:hypothetical protein
MKHLILKKMSKQTAVEWLVEQILKEKGLVDLDIEQAKEREKEQSQNYAEFAIKCDREGMKILEFDSYINL